MSRPPRPTDPQALACQPEPRRHWPIFSPPDLPDGLAECLVCRDWITAVDLLEGVCSGPPVTHSDQLNAWRSVDDFYAERAWERLAAQWHQVCRTCGCLPCVCGRAERPIYRGPVTAAPSLADPRAAERERTLAMIQRCAERQW